MENQQVLWDFGPFPPAFKTLGSPRNSMHEPSLQHQVDTELHKVPSRQSAGKGSRLLVLDGLRAIAICLVLLHHYSQNMAKSGPGDRAFFYLGNSSWVGVDLFFVLSGFLITSILYDAKGSPSYFRTFYIRRSLRIFPIYYLMLLAIFVILPFFHLSIVDEGTLKHAPWFWLYGSNYLTGLVEWPDTAVSHLWSLAIEEHFYLLWPVVIYLGNKTQLLIGGTVFLFAACILRFNAASHGVSNDAIYVLTQYRIDILVMGSLLALGWKTPELRSAITRHAGKAAILLAAAILAGCSGRFGIDWRLWSPGQLAVGFSLIGLFFVAIHIVCLKLSSGSVFYTILTCAPALWLGRLSYGMYLFHRPIEAVSIQLGLHPSMHVVSGFPNWPYTLVYILGNSAATALLAWLTWNLFEKHVLRLKDRFNYLKVES